MEDDPWTPAMIQQVRELAAHKLSSSEIGLKVGKSRLSIIGKCRREGIPLLCDFLVKDPNAAPPPPKQVRNRSTLPPLPSEGGPDFGLGYSYES